MTATALRRGRPRRGVSLVEVMVSLVIGLVVVGAVMVSYLGSGTSGRQQSAFSTMTEDAQIAFTILQRDISMAGYSRPIDTATAASGTVTFTKALSTRSIFGCDTGFTSPSASSSTIACGGSATQVIEVVYEADRYTSPGGNKDCIGNTIAATDVTAGATATMAYNRYYVSNSASGRPELHCASSGQTGQPLIENVESMQISYGEAAASDVRQVVRYVSAANVTSWDRVVAVRICLLMRSAEPVLTDEDISSYTDCSQATVTPVDKYARRAYFSTITLRNRMGF